MKLHGTQLTHKMLKLIKNHLLENSSFVTFNRRTADGNSSRNCQGIVRAVAEIRDVRLMARLQTRLNVPRYFNASLYSTHIKACS